MQEEGPDPLEGNYTSLNLIPLQEEASLPSLSKTLMFPEVGIQTSFFPLSGESP